MAFPFRLPPCGPRPRPAPNSGSKRFTNRWRTRSWRKSRAWNHERIDMKAVILAAGKGTRMGQLTEQLPKPMLRVQGKPILEHILEGLLQAGVRDFFIVIGFRGDVIEDYFGAGGKWSAAFH